MASPPDHTDDRSGERRWPEAMFRALVDHASDIITILDANGIVVYESPSKSDVLGYAPDELVGSDPFTLIHPDDAQAIQALFHEVAGEPGRAAAARFRFRHKDGSWRWLDVNGVNLLHDPSVRGLVANSRDVTAGHLLEEQLRESERHHRALHAEARRQAREQALLDEVRTALAHDLELADLIRTVVNGIAATFGYSLVSLYLRDGDVLTLQYQVGYERQIERIPLSDGIAGRVVRTGEPILLSDVRADPTFLGAIPGIVSEICVPLHDEGRVAGFLNLESTDEEPLTERDLHLLVALSQHVGVAIGRARLYTELRTSEARFRALAQHAADMMSVLDEKGRHTYVSPAWEQILGHSPGTLLGRPLSTISCPEPGADDPLAFAALAGQSDSPNRFEARVRHADGSRRWLEVISVNRLDDPDLRGVVVTARDITERKALQARLWHQAHHDPLTGLPNRALFLKRLDQALHSVRTRSDGEAAVLLFLDFDGFKSVNDRFGHHAGDALLVLAAQRLQQTIRASDLIARFGGDEFAVLLAPGADLEHATSLAGQLVTRLAAPFDIEGQAVSITASVGIVASPKVTGLRDTLRAADAAHYRAKVFGHGTIAVFDPVRDASLLDWPPGPRV